jgi:hypothetical protein
MMSEDNNEKPDGMQLAKVAPSRWAFTEAGDFLAVVG